MAESIPLSRGLEARKSKLDIILQRLDDSRSKATELYRLVSEEISHEMSQPAHSANFGRMSDLEGKREHLAMLLDHISAQETSLEKGMEQIEVQLRNLLPPDTKGTAGG
jgi:chaperonin cofactor prefoldin